MISRISIKPGIEFNFIALNTQQVANDVQAYVNFDPADISQFTSYSN